MSAEQEEQACDALVNLGSLETEQGLHAEGVRAIQDVLHCSLDDARVGLRDLRVRKRIEKNAAPAEHSGQLRFRWTRPDH